MTGEIPDLPEAAGSLGIGELSRLAGVPVRTIRYYCDEGILDARRSAGGHRRFDRADVDRLMLLRRLRGLGLGLPAIVTVLTGERSMHEAVAAERRALDVEVAALSWRRASLRAVEDADPAERALRLALLAAVEDGRAARDALIRFWRGLMVAPLPQRLADAFIDLSVPEPLADPAPEQVVAYAEMVALAGDRSLMRKMRARARVNAERIEDEPTLMIGVGEGVALAGPALAAGEPPAGGPALDRFVEVHALVRGARKDGPEFRRGLLAELSLDQDPRAHRYWDLVGEVTGEVVTLGAAHLWLVRALGYRSESGPG